VQRQVGVNRPVFGHLFATEIRRSGATIDSDAFDSLAIEAEFAARIAVDIPDASWLREHPEQSIAAFFPVIELHNNAFRGATRTAQELIANNALHAGVVPPRWKVRSAMPKNFAANPSRSSVTQNCWGPRPATRFPAGLSAPC
jgi:2-keto-4-pentenoate hydratase